MQKIYIFFTWSQIINYSFDILILQQVWILLDWTHCALVTGRCCKVSVYNFQTHFSIFCSENFPENCPQVNAIVPIDGENNVWSDNNLVPPGNKPLPPLMLTKISDALWHNYALIFTVIVANSSHFRPKWIQNYRQYQFWIIFRIQITGVWREFH